MTDQAIFDAYLQLSAEKVAEQFGCSPQKVLNAVRRIDATKIRKRGRPMSFAPEPVTQNDWDELDSLTADTPVAVTPAE